ncbi:MAG: formate dehydrogenase accessory sulfurtransferase FdhD [Candidatus Lokiarchaeota archaeon]|nr:formate dehydrogenase accessory sulfurtransferase FdhD [Candidatus Lokiarchaeota archaeon]
MFQRKVNITKIHKGTQKEEIDLVLIESPIDIVVNSEPLVNIICLDKDLKELTIGFLFSIGIINDIADISEIKIDQVEGKVSVELSKSIDLSNILEMNPVSRVIDTTCGIPSPWRNLIKDKLEGVKNSDQSKESITVDHNIIFSAMIKMQRETPLFKETGGCHGAAIFDLQGNIVAVNEDIGRHNAIDKVIGTLLLKKEPFSNKILTSTGRLTGDSVLKAVRAQIPIVASLSAAIESGIRLAFSYGITLIGFARGKRMNIYTNPYRIKI